ncbi:polysaccharide biosynthesis tyrosine autokinase [Phocicoccus pinnipedialis]|uniref:non-specific protein-tyrosine kinase n=1 Tax=Phocicoccus pinnipedialis TaxID=110845 RepID=A0A6V7R2N8_9BACL|nr:polysaccharide biosynthesis tyrosine autokinase [Jeotgalicoccus pinnipedialis]MBP1938804.1 capsular exopolysaccharide synthesis family protein [Jeotgalicoccus pinnipedialis]CAD2071601.1 Tyrosine-protein kinase YwqD [Jeotgalicoccus pinnipedialis]
MAKKKQKLNPLITYEAPKSPVSEKFRGIRTNISFSRVDNNINSLIVTAEKPDAGKSTITSNIAITYAQSGLRTLIIDGDMRKPTQHYIFNETNTKGLSSLIVENGEPDDFIKPTHIENLFLLTSGPIPPNPSELIGSTRFKEVFNKLKTQFDMIIIDTPPTLSVTDSQLFSKLAHNVVLVIDAENNNREEVKRGKELIEQSGAKILGVILNKATLEKNTSNYYYYYGDE